MMVGAFFQRALQSVHSAPVHRSMHSMGVSAIVRAWAIHRAAPSPGAISDLPSSTARGGGGAPDSRRPVGASGAGRLGRGATSLNTWPGAAPVGGPRRRAGRSPGVFIWWWCLDRSRHGDGHRPRDRVISARELGVGGSSCQKYTEMMQVTTCLGPNRGYVVSVLILT